MNVSCFYHVFFINFNTAVKVCVIDLALIGRQCSRRDVLVEEPLHQVGVRLSIRQGFHARQEYDWNEVSAVTFF